MTTHTEDQGAGAGEVAAATTRRGVSRRTALKAAVATGAAIYAIPAIDTLTAHAAGVSTFKNNNVFIRTCGGSATFKSPYGDAPATVTIAPTAGCGGNNVTINDPNSTVVICEGRHDLLPYKARPVSQEKDRETARCSCRSSRPPRSSARTPPPSGTCSGTAASLRTSSSI